MDGNGETTIAQVKVWNHPIQTTIWVPGIYPQETKVIWEWREVGPPPKKKKTNKLANKSCSSGALALPFMSTTMQKVAPCCECFKNPYTQNGGW